MQETTASVKLNDNGEGLVKFEGATFIAMRDGVKVGDLVLIIEADQECVLDGDYSNGDIYRVVEVEKDEISINETWNNPTYDRNIWLDKDEYTVLKPINFKAILMSMSLEKGKAPSAKSLSEMIEESKLKELKELTDIEQVDDYKSFDYECEDCPLYEEGLCEGKTNEEMQAEIQEGIDNGDIEPLEELKRMAEKVRKFLKPDNELTREEIITKAKNTLNAYKGGFTYDPTGQKAYFEIIEGIFGVTAYLKEKGTDEIIKTGVCSYTEGENELVVVKAIACFRASDDKAPDILLNLPKE